MDTQLKQVIYNLERQWGKRVEVKKYHPTDIDFSDPKFNASTESVTIKAVPLPHHSIQINFVPNQGDYESFDRVFLLRVKTIPFQLVVKQTFIIYQGRRYNISKIDILDDLFYVAGCVGEPGESHE